MLEWLQAHDGMVWTIGIVSLVVLVASLFIIPAIVVRLPSDYFAHERRPPSRMAGQNPGLRLALRIGKNLLGALLMLAGIGMLLLPGQGLLTLLVGFFLIDAPGKYRLERRLAALPWVLKPINWIRSRRHKQPLRIWHRTHAA